MQPKTKKTTVCVRRTWFIHECWGISASNLEIHSHIGNPHKHNRPSTKAYRMKCLAFKHEWEYMENTFCSRRFKGCLFFFFKLSYLTWKIIFLSYVQFKINNKTIFITMGANTPDIIEYLCSPMSLTKSSFVFYSLYEHTTQSITFVTFC